MLLGVLSISCGNSPSCQDANQPWTSVIEVVPFATLRRLHRITNANNNCALNYFDYKAKLFALPDYCVHIFTASDGRKVSLHHSGSFGSRSGPIPCVPSRALQVRSPFHQTTLAHCDELFPNMLRYRSILTPLTQARAPGLLQPFHRFLSLAQILVTFRNILHHIDRTFIPIPWLNITDIFYLLSNHGKTWLRLLPIDPTL